MQTPEFQAKYAAGPRGILTLLPKTNMGANLGLTFLYFLAVSFALASLASLAFKPGTEFLLVFRFVFAAAFAIFLAGDRRSTPSGSAFASSATSSSRWPTPRSPAAIFAGMWPSA